MPYVLQDRRVGLREPVDALRTTDAELPFVIAAIALVVESGINVEDVAEVSKELAAREKRGDDITGDINFCICRTILGHTSIHTDPRYSKIHLINRSLKKADVVVVGAFSTNDFSEERIERATGVIEDVKLGLYSRYAVDYEAKKRAENGDIMD